MDRKLNRLTYHAYISWHFITKVSQECGQIFLKALNTVEPRYNKQTRDWQNLFTITRFCYIEALFPNILLLTVKKIVCYTKDFVIWTDSLYRGSNHCIQLIKCH